MLIIIAFLGSLVVFQSFIILGFVVKKFRKREKKNPETTETAGTMGGPNIIDMRRQRYNVNDIPIATMEEFKWDQQGEKKIEEGNEEGIAETYSYRRPSARAFTATTFVEELSEDEGDDASEAAVTVVEAEVSEAAVTSVEAEVSEADAKADAVGAPTDLSSPSEIEPTALRSILRHSLKPGSSGNFLAEEAEAKRKKFLTASLAISSARREASASKSSGDRIELTALAVSSSSIASANAAETALQHPGDESEMAGAGSSAGSESGSTTNDRGAIGTDEASIV